MVVISAGNFFCCFDTHFVLMAMRFLYFRRLDGSCQSVHNLWLPRRLESVKSEIHKNYKYNHFCVAVCEDEVRRSMFGLWMGQ